MKRITANTTLENFAFPVSSANVSATVAGLACEMTVDKNDCLANHLSLVLDKTQELLCAPASNKLSGFLPNFAFSFHISSSQFFESNSIAILINDCFRDAMIHISDEPSLSPSQFLQMSFGGASACSLKASLQMLIPSLDFTKSLAIEKLIVRSDCWIVNSSVNPNNFLDISLGWSFCFNYYVQKYYSFLGSDSCGIRFAEIIPLEVRWDLDSIFFPSFNCAYAYHLGIREKPESVVIEPDRRCLLFSGLNLEFEPFEHVAGLVSDSSNETAIELRMSFPNQSISKLMQSGFVESLCFHSNVYTLLAGLIAQPDCSYQVIVSDDFRPNCYLHNIPLNHNLFIYVVFLSPYENQKIKTCSLQHKLSFSVVSEISQESIDWRSQGFDRANYSGDMFTERVGAYQPICAARPLARFSFRFSDIQSNVCSQGLEGSNGNQGNERTSFCQEILESELLCWDSRNSHREDYSEIYSRTRNEVNESQFLTATRLQCSLAT